MARPRSEQPQQTAQAATRRGASLLDRDGTCDVIDLRYRLIHPAPTGGEPAIALVEVILHYRLERCPVAHARRARLHDHAAARREGQAVHDSPEDSLHLRQRDESQPPERADHRGAVLHVEHGRLHVGPHGRRPAEHDQYGIGASCSGGHFETNGAIQAFFPRPSVDVSGKLQREDDERLHAPAPTARRLLRSPFRARRSGPQTPCRSGRCSTRSHAEGTSEDHFESSSREFANPNRCHAITFFFYRVNKTQTVRFTLESIERRVLDPAADTKVANNRFLARGGVSAIPEPILATHANSSPLWRRSDGKASSSSWRR